MPMRENMRGSEPEGNNDEGERISVFVGPEFFKGEKKVGDHPSIVIKDKDPESGQYELVCDEKYGESKDLGYESDFDRAMPEEEVEA